MRAHRNCGQGKPWSFDGDGKLFRLVAEALRILLAHLFDPVLAVPTPRWWNPCHTRSRPSTRRCCRGSRCDSLADDPGAGKTIMAGLLMKEMIARGDLQRCLVVCPGSLAEQWQDRLYRRFHLKFDILTNDKLEASATGNWFRDTNLHTLDRQARQTLSQRRCPGEAARARLPMGPGRLRRGAQALGDVLRR